MQAALNIRVSGFSRYIDDIIIDGVEYKVLAEVAGYDNHAKNYFPNTVLQPQYKYGPSGAEYTEAKEPEIRVLTTSMTEYRKTFILPYILEYKSKLYDHKVTFIEVLYYYHKNNVPLGQNGIYARQVLACKEVT